MHHIQEVGAAYAQYVHHLPYPQWQNLDVIFPDELASCLINDLPFPVGQSILECILGEEVVVLFLKMLHATSRRSKSDIASSSELLLFVKRKSSKAL